MASQKTNSDGGGDTGKNKHGEKLLQDPSALAAALKEAQERESLAFNWPPVVRRRVNALKKIQLETVKVEMEFYKKVFALECEYASAYKQQAGKRKEIVLGNYEPTDEECKIPQSEEELAEELQKVSLQNGPEEEKDIKGIPEFWLTTFKNVDILAAMIEEHDEPILKHLTDVDLVMSNEPMGFTFFFHFSPNEYFTNSTLTKEYILKCEPDPDEPYDFDGPEIINCKGCKIEWKSNKNVTVKLVKKKQKHKQKGATRFVTKEVKNDSFFNFFDPAVIPEGGEEELDDDTRDLLNADFEIGQILRDRILPRAVLYFTGEAHDEDDEDYEEEDDEEDDDDMDDDDESDDEKEKSNPKKTDEKPAECKQQ